MKFLKKNIAVILAFAAILLIIGSVYVAFFVVDPPVGQKEITDTDKYLKTNFYVRQTIKEDVSSWFPRKIPKNCDADYLYYYSCGLLSYPNFFLLLDLKFQDEAAFETQKSKIADIECYEILHDDETEYRIISKPYNLKYYLDDEVNEMGWRFRIIVINENERSVQYLAAYIDSVEVKHERIMEILEAVYVLEQEAPYIA